MTKQKYGMNSGLSWLEKILQLYREYGVFGILKGLFILIMLSITLRICYNPEFLFDKYTEYVKNKHSKELCFREKMDQQVRSMLPTLMYKYDASRVWIIQYHNGIMDWRHGTMRFELCGRDVESIKYQYDDFNLTWLSLPYYLKEHDMFIGDLNQVDEIDHTFKTQLEKSNIQYLACTLIRDSSGYIIGIFGVSWKEIPRKDDINKLREDFRTFLIEDRAAIGPLIQMNYKKDKK